MHSVLLSHVVAACLALPQDAGGAKSFQQQLDEMEKRHQEEMQELRDQIDALADKPAQAAPATSPMQSLNVFNPQLTVFGNFLGRTDDRHVLNDNGDRIDDRFSLREAEIDFRAAVDPWADAVLIASFEADTPGEFSATIEEGYITLKKLPLLDSTPLGIQFEIGRFRPAFGRINKIHTHDLPWMDRPGSFTNLFGTEGFSQDGISAQAFIPTPGTDNTLELTVQAVNGGDLPAAPDNHANNPAYVQHLSWFWDVAPGNDIELGQSAYFGYADLNGLHSSEVLGLDATYHWKPFRAGEWQSFLFGGELFAASVEQTAAAASRPLGWYAWTQYQFDQNVYLGLRYDWHQTLFDDSVRTHQIGAFLTYYTTEFLRFRIGVEHMTSGDPALNGLDSALIELNFVFGSHPVEPYWVNK
jgi:hypothetical protein